MKKQLRVLALVMAVMMAFSACGKDEVASISEVSISETPIEDLIPQVSESVSEEPEVEVVEEPEVEVVPEGMYRSELTNEIDVCASCNQPLSRNNNNIFGSGEFLSGNMSNLNMSKIKSSNRSLLNYTQPSNYKSNNNSERSMTNLNLGNSKLPDIIPSIHPK